MNTSRPLTRSHGENTHNFILNTFSASMDCFYFSSRTVKDWNRLLANTVNSKNISSLFALHFVLYLVYSNIANRESTERRKVVSGRRFGNFWLRWWLLDGTTNSRLTYAQSSLIILRTLCHSIPVILNLLEVVRFLIHMFAKSLLLAVELCWITKVKASHFTFLL